MISGIFFPHTLHECLKSLIAQKTINKQDQELNDLEGDIKYQLPISSAIKETVNRCNQKLHQG